MKKRETDLRAELLEKARELVAEHGAANLNIRALAACAGVATGTIYNYFACKDDILLALTEDAWSQTMLTIQSVTCATFLQELKVIYELIGRRYRPATDDLIANLSNSAYAKNKTAQMLDALKSELLCRMEMDESVRPVRTGAFTREKFADFLVTNMNDALARGDDGAFLFAVVKRILY